MFKYVNKFVKNIHSTSFLKSRKFLTANFPELSLFPREIKNYESLHKFSIEENDFFWSTLAKSRLDWYKPFEKVKEGDFSKNVDLFDLKWFINGKLNASGNLKA